MLKKYLYMYAMFIFSFTAIQATEEVVEKENIELQADCGCGKKKNQKKVEDEATLLSCVEDDNEELEKTNDLACEIIDNEKIDEENAA